ncbi:MAG: MotA/TolQ/ExbB proton channel family protein [Candidimonas sp.]|nr:MAG: MotA/TolQ/ExbB proton channel family protein [Candidimonas sp.]
MNTGIYGLAHIWTQGDFVTRLVFSALAAMSILTWVVILIKAFDLWRHRGQAARLDDFWRAREPDRGLPEPGRLTDNPFHTLAAEALAATRRRGPNAPGTTPGADDDVAQALRYGMDDARSRLQSGLTVLASVGSTAPFVGLFGTVWGIYHALMAISVAGQASIDQVAGPIGEALIMTAMGLAAAIPAVLGYNALVRGNKTVLARLRRFAHHLRVFCATGERPSAPRNRSTESLRTR